MRNTGPSVDHTTNSDKGTCNVYFLNGSFDESKNACFIKSEFLTQNIADTVMSELKLAPFEYPKYN